MPRGKLYGRTKKQIDELPEHNQHIFKKAHESALKHYKDPGKRRSKSDRPEEVAHKVAWSAVKKKYKKSGDKWVSKKKTKWRARRASIPRPAVPKTAAMS